MANTRPSHPVVTAVAATVLGTLVLLGALELGARLLASGEGDDEFLSLRGSISFFREVEEDGHRFYEIDHPDAEVGKGTRFAIDKSPGAVRVFVLGGSAAAGWPHPKEETFSAYLEEALRAALPERRVEVLNVAGHGHASYRVRDVFEDVVGFEPDLLVLWSGNNEFFEVRSYRTTPWLAVVREHSALVRTVARLGALDGTRRDDARARHAASTKILREPHRMRVDPDEFRGVKDHYAFSVDAMTALAEAAGVPLLVATVPSNLRDWHPQVSWNDLAGETRLRWRARYDRGRALLASGRPRRSVRPLENALRLAPDHAETHFLLGRGYEANGDRERAARHYREAADLDYSPLRALGAFNDALREITARRTGSHLVDLEALFAAHAAGAAPGFDLFLDYVHPTREGNRLAARSVFDAIRRDGLLPALPGDARFPEEVGDASYTDEGDPFLQARVFMLCLSMHQHEGVQQVGPRLVAHLEADPSLARTRAFVRLGLSLARVRAMVEESARYVEMERRSLLGLPYDVRYEERYRDMLIQIFEKFGVVESEEG